MKKGIIISLYTIIGIIIFGNCLYLGYQYYNDTKDVKIKNTYQLKLNGDSNISLAINEEYNDEKATIMTDDNKYDISYQGTIDNTKIGKYYISYNDDSGSIIGYNVYRIVDVIDINAPTIKLKGKTSMEMYVGDTYKEPGYEVIDDHDTDLQDKVVVEGEVNRKKVGTYTLTYKVSDSSGNEVSVKRTIKVKNRPVSTKIAPTADKSEKGETSAKKPSLTKNTNTLTAMKWTANGVNVSGYVKSGHGIFRIRLCKGNNCEKIDMKATNVTSYTGDIKLSNLENGTYEMNIVTEDNEYAVIDERNVSEKLVRAKVGNKLVTFTYPNNHPTIKIEDFKYLYDIVITPGHGGSDSGAVNSKIKERDLNLTQSLYEKKRYEEHGLKVLLTREDNGEGMLMGPTSLIRLHRRMQAVGYYGAVAHFVYDNHHNSIGNDYYSGWEIILTNQGDKNTYKVPYAIAKDWEKIYPVSEKHLRIYGRNYDTDSLLKKESGQTYDIKNWYAYQRIPYELFNVYTTTYEGCYLSNMDDFNWYMEHWKELSEVKIKHYVEALGKTYIPVKEEA